MFATKQRRVFISTWVLCVLVSWLAGTNLRDYSHSERGATLQMEGWRVEEMGMPGFILFQCGWITLVWRHVELLGHSPWFTFAYGPVISPPLLLQPKICPF